MSEHDGIERVLRDLASAPSAFDAWRDGAECPSEVQLAAFAEGRASEAEAGTVRAHLERCGACLGDVRAAVEELEEVAAETSAPRTPVNRTGTTTGNEERRHPLRLVSSPAAWAGVAAAALLLVLWNPFGGSGGAGGPDPRLAVALAEIEAIPARVPRGDADEAELAFREGLTFYLEERWTDAEAALARAASLAPERADIALYRGSVTILLDRPEEALGHLERAKTAEGAPGREAIWQIAQAHLALADPDAARAALEELGDSGHRAAGAQAMLAEIAELGF